MRIYKFQVKCAWASFSNHITNGRCYPSCRHHWKLKTLATLGNPSFAAKVRFTADSVGNISLVLWSLFWINKFGFKHTDA